MTRRACILAFLLACCTAALTWAPPLFAGASPAQPRRLAALSPALAATLRDLGAGEMVVGRHAFDEHSPATIPVVGDQHGVDYEALLRARPTHVLLERGAGGVPPRLLSLAESRGWSVEALPMLSLGDIRSATRRLADLAGTQAARDAADRLLEEMDLAWSPQPGVRERAGRTLLLYWTDPPGAAGPGSFHHQLLTALGGSPAPAEGRPYITLDLEDLRRLDPDSVILFSPGADPSRREALLRPLARADLRALREGRFLLVHDPMCQIPSPGMIAVARDIARAAQSWPPLGPAAP